MSNIIASVVGFNQASVLGYPLEWYVNKLDQLNQDGHTIISRVGAIALPIFELYTAVIYLAEATIRVPGACFKIVLNIFIGHDIIDDPNCEKLYDFFPRPFDVIIRLMQVVLLVEFAVLGVIFGIQDPSKNLELHRFFIFPAPFALKYKTKTERLQQEIKDLKAVIGDPKKQQKPRRLTLEEKFELKLSSKIKEEKVVSKEIKEPEKLNEEPEGFDAVFGMEEAKESLQKIIDILLYLEFAKQNGLNHLPGVILLTGPDGCGKEFLAEKFVEELSKQLKKKFSLEEFSLGLTLGENEVCFLDLPKMFPIDQKNSNEMSSLPTLSKNDISLLSKLDKELFDQARENHRIVICTAPSEKEIDSLFIKKNSFDKVIKLSYPDTETRMQLLRQFFKDIPQEEDIDLSPLAEVLKGCPISTLKDATQRAAQYIFELNLKEHKKNSEDPIKHKLNQQTLEMLEGMYKHK